MLLRPQMRRRRYTGRVGASSEQPAYPLHPEVVEPTGPAHGDLEGSEYGPAGPLIAPEKVTTAKIAAGAVGAAKLAAEAVAESALSAAVAAKLLGAGRVISSYIAAGAVTAEKLAAEAVEESKLAAAVAEKLLGTERVLTGFIKGEAVTEPKLAAAVVTKLNEKGGGESALVWKKVEEVNASLTEEPAEQAPLRVAVDGRGVVHLSGNLRASAEILAQTKLFKLPVGCRPEHYAAGVIPISATTTSCTITIEPNGEVKIGIALKVTQTLLSLNGVQFATTDH